MTLFQIIILIIIALIIAKAIRRLVKKDISVWLLLVWVGFWGLLALITFFPEIINRAADWVGIGRGVDLLIYLALVALFYFVFRLSIKLNKIERKQSDLVRKIALTKVEKRGGEGD